MSVVEGRVSLSRRRAPRPQRSWGDTDPNSCTIEMTHGRFLHVLHTPDEIEDLCAQAEDQINQFKGPGRQGDHGPVSYFEQRGPAFITVRRSGSRGHGFDEVKINPKHIIAILPLHSTTEIL